MVAETLRCWHCGHANPPGAKFCANCGRPQRVCPQCGAGHAEGARFCASCGHPLASGAQPAADAGAILAAETRKVVTVLFADLVGSTGLTERLDPEEARQVVAAFYEVAQQAVERFGGSVANLLGDAVLAVFGLPLAHEDDAERAVRAGVALRDAMPALNERLARAHDVRLETRIGIDTGEVVAASGSTFDRDFLISDAVTTAARLQQTVAPGAVVVGERTQRLTRDAIAYRDLPPLEVKGKAAPLAAWEALAPLPDRPEVRRLAAPLVGRDGDLGLLRHLFRRSAGERMVTLVTILGQPGVGKSRLLREFLAEVRERDPRPTILRGRSLAFGGQIGYHALLEILRGQAELLDTDPPERVRAKLAAWLDGALPGRADLLDGLLLTFGAGDGQADPARVRRRLFDAWQALLVGLAAAGPVIAAFEDLHWADDGLLDLLEQVTTGVEDGSLFVVCLARPDLLERRPAWGAGARNATRIDLTPLRPRDAEHLVAALSSRSLAPGMREMIAQRAGGNPLFVEELVRMVLEGSAPGAAIPDTVQGVLAARIDRLPLGERRALQAAAVVGRTFWPSAVGPLAGLAEAEAAGAIAALVAKDLVVAHPQSVIAGEREYAFRHILIRDVAYGMLPRAQRQRAHAEAARWLEGRLGGRVEDVVEVLAQHLRLSGDDARAADYLHRAAGKARRLYANADALRLYGQALEAADKAGLGPLEIAALHRGRGEVHQLLGAYPAARADFEEGLRAASETGDRAAEALLENRIGLVHHREARFDDAEVHFRRAADLARAVGDTLTLGQSLVDLANIAWDRQAMRPDHAALVEGLALLRDAGDPSSLARALNLLCMARLGEGDGPGALAAAEQALRVAREAGDKQKAATSLSYLSRVHGFLSNFDEAIRLGREALALADEIGDRRRRAYALTFIGEPHVLIGRWPEGIRLLEESLVLVGEIVRLLAPWPYLYLGTAWYEIGDHGRARRAFAGGIDAREGWPGIAQACAASDARLAGDARRLDEALDGYLRVPKGEFVPADAEAMLPVGDALADAGRFDDLRALLAQCRPNLERLGAASCRAGMAILDARLAAHGGRTDEAAAHLDAARRWSEACGNLVTLRRALELRLALDGRPEDRAALRTLLARLAAALPDDLRETFLHSPRAAALRDG